MLDVHVHLHLCASTGDGSALNFLKIIFSYFFKNILFHTFFLKCKIIAITKGEKASCNCTFYGEIRGLIESLQGSQISVWLDICFLGWYNIALKLEVMKSSSFLASLSQWRLRNGCSSISFMHSWIDLNYSGPWCPGGTGRLKNGGGKLGGGSEKSDLFEIWLLTAKFDTRILVWWLAAKAIHIFGLRTASI